MHLRASKTPDQFLASYYTAAGNNFIAAQRVGHDKAMNDLAKAGISQAAERSSWNAFVTEYGKMNPIWWDDYASTTKKHVATEAFSDFTNMFTKNIKGKIIAKTDAEITKEYGAHVVPIKNLVNDWNEHHKAVIQLRATGGTEYVKDENDAWQKYLVDVGNKQPQLNTVINSVFSRLG
jgi:hypothetical protein